MTTEPQRPRDRAWLRSFLDLGARRLVERIPEEAILRQEDTVLSALEILDREPGVLLADEVGMGKTYQALGLVAAMFQRKTSPKILVVTPREVLNAQWMNAATRFRELKFHDFPADAFAQANHLSQLPDQCARHAVVLTPVTVFAGVRSPRARGFLLAKWARQRGIHGSTLAAITRRLAQSDLPFEPAEDFLDRPLSSFADLPEQAYTNATSGGPRGFDDLLREGADAFLSGDAVKAAFHKVRFHLIGTMLPCFDLLIVDEAHKLKNPWSVRSQAVSQILGQRYEKAALLTATPFQLGVSELRQVFELFGNARHARPGFAEDVERLFHGIASYQDALADFEQSWQHAEPGHVAGVASWYAAARTSGDAAFPSIEDANVRCLAQRAWRMKSIVRGEIEPGLRRWTLRSLKPDKVKRRSLKAQRLECTAEAIGPVLMHERLLVERLRRGERTHVSAADTNISSSFQAALGGTLLSDEIADVDATRYRLLAREMIEDFDASHPKVDHVVGQALESAGAWAKTLIFCERTETVRQIVAIVRDEWMADQLTEWQAVAPGAGAGEIFGDGGLFERLGSRFSKGNSELSVALLDVHPHSLFVPPGGEPLPPAFWSDRDAILAESNAILAEQRATPTSAERLDYRLARRCVDQAVARWMERRAPERMWSKFCGVLLHRDYVRLGLDLDEDDEERSIAGGDTQPVTWHLSADAFEAILSPAAPGAWFPLRAKLDLLPSARIRDMVITAARRFLVQRQVPFLVALVRRTRAPEPSSELLRATMEDWWRDASCPWLQRLSALLDALLLLGETEQEAVIAEGLNAESVVQHALDAEARTRRQHAFNAPFFPLVLVGSQVMQEGLDLHRQCRRLIHHDLRWNPADLEQRVGRVDRHGSLSSRLYQQGLHAEEAAILVLHPLLRRTNDMSQYRVVKEREKWLELLLGRTPDEARFDAEGMPMPELPPELADDLRVDLRPREWE